MQGTILLLGKSIGMSYLLNLFYNFQAPYLFAFKGERVDATQVKNSASHVLLGRVESALADFAVCAFDGRHSLPVSLLF
jgi:hypothetical protein